jgi:hypothetical protein
MGKHKSPGHSSFHAATTNDTGGCLLKVTPDTGESPNATFLRLASTMTGAAPGWARSAGSRRDLRRVPGHLRVRR